MRTLIIILAILAAISFAPANARAAGEVSLTLTLEEAMNLKGPFLVVLTLNSVGSSFRFRYHKMQTIDVCHEAIKNSRIRIPQGGDAEAVVGLYCTYDLAKYLMIGDD